MIEKRFVLDDEGIVTDRADLSMYIDNEDCCEKLNELHEDNIILKSELSFSLNHNRELRKILEDNRSMAEVVDENKKLKKQMNRLYNYFWDWHSDEMEGNQFSEMWDMVKKSKYWDEEW